MDKLIVSQPEYGEMGLGTADELARSHAIDLIVIDSVRCVHVT